MQEFGCTANLHRKIFFVVFVTSVSILMISYYDSTKLINTQMFFTTPENESTNNGTKYLVSTSKCKIVDLDPFSKDAKRYFKPLKYKSCSQHRLLTYVTKEDNISTLNVDKDLIPVYTSKDVKCCYSNVTRFVPTNNPDSSIKISDCKTFSSKVQILTDAVLVKCTESRADKKIYENVHTSVRITDEVQKKINNTDNGAKLPSVLFIGIDSISRLNFLRTMPDTYKYVNDHGWLTLDGYNKMDDNTFPNLMAIFTGYNQSRAYEVCNPKVAGMLDECPLLWFTYGKLGYITAYGEDEGAISTFNYNKKGFIKPPADYYYRPYILATEKLPKTGLNGMNYCTGPETAGERILNLIKDFTITLKDYPTFGIFWMNSFSHNEINSPMMLDNKVKLTLEELGNNGIYNNSLVIFLSDHGMRFGDIRLTETGWLEERLPFIYFSFPADFKEKFPTEYNNFLNNRNKLTTPYDLYMTLQNILVLYKMNYTVSGSDACPNCTSLFAEIETERSCEDAAIEQHWCTCAGYTETILDPTVHKSLSTFVEEKLHQITSNTSRGGGDGKCAKYIVVEFISTRLSHKLTYKSSTYILVSFKTEPKAVFEMTIKYDGDIRLGNFTSSDISRLDSYNGHSKCVDDAFLKKYCYCIK
ncbi:uncharacterized protein LOC132702979 isoform X2 [Cylas formicarius]|nr:uncharacterized protein LOC132702979 isoform X2 [Cylas formicarius]